MDHRVVLCDLDGVVLDYPAAEAMAFAGTATRLGLHDLGTVRPLYAEANRACWQAYERGELSADELRIERWARLFAVLGVTADPVIVSTDYLGRLARAGPVLPGAVRALRRLAAAVPVVAVTNGFSDVVHGRLASSGTRDLFDAVLVADEVDAPKPDPAMFRAALAMAGARPVDAVMVGDNHHADIEGAHALDIATVWITPEATERSQIATWQHPSLAVTAEVLLGADAA